MKIAYIYDAVYPWIKGGVEKRLYEIGRRLVERGYDVHWFGVRWWEGGRDVEMDGIRLHGVCGSTDLYSGGRRRISEAVHFALSLLLKFDGKFDVVDCQSFPYFSCFSSRLRARGSGYVITWHEVWGSYWYEYLGSIGFFGRVVERMTAKLSSAAVAVSERTKRDLLSLGYTGDVYVVPNGINFGEVIGVECGEETDVIFVGRLIKEKNVDLLLKAVSILKKENPDIRCTIVGDGPERVKLERLSFELDVSDNVVFTGFLEKHEDVLSRIKGSGVLALPSIREGFGIVALEAMACGVPVVTVDAEKNAASDLVRDFGLVCRPDERELAECIKKGFELGKRMAFVKKLVERAKAFDWENVTSRMEEVYECVSSGSP